MVNKTPVFAGVFLCFCAAYLKPPRAALPPMPPPSLHRRGAAAPLRWTLAPLRVARGMAAPASATAPPLARRGAACAGGGCPRRWRGCGWNSLVPTLFEVGTSLALRLGRCPRREDRRGSSRRSARSLGRLRRLRPAGFGWGRARIRLIKCLEKISSPKGQQHIRLLCILANPTGEYTP